MTYYIDLGFSDCQVAAAVAEAAIHELNTNFGFPGFPQIDVSDGPGSSFTITMRWNNAAAAQFELSEPEVISAVKNCTFRTDHDPALFDKVRRAVADLEGMVSR